MSVLADPVATAAPGRRPCPVLTCSNDAPSGQLMCLACWGRLPRYARLSVDSTLAACRRQNTRANRARHEAARANAVRLAAEFRS